MPVAHIYAVAVAVVADSAAAAAACGFIASSLNLVPSECQFLKFSADLRKLAQIIYIMRI